MIRASNPDADAYEAITKQLRRYRSMVANYQACKELYDEMFPSGVAMLTDMPRGGSQTTEGDRYADRRWNMRERLEKSLNEMESEIWELMKIIQSLEPEQSAVLMRRYVFGDTWDMVADKLNYCKRRCENIHDKAIRTIQERG